VVDLVYLRCSEAFDRWERGEVVELSAEAAEELIRKNPGRFQRLEKRTRRIDHGADYSRGGARAD